MRIVPGLRPVGADIFDIVIFAVVALRIQARLLSSCSTLGQGIVDGLVTIRA